MRGGESDLAREEFRGRFAAAYEAAVKAGRVKSRRDFATQVQRSNPTVGDWFKKGGAIPDGGAMLAIPSALGCNGHWLLTGEGSMYAPVAEPELLYYRGALAVLGELDGLHNEIGRRWTLDAERARARAEAAAGDPAATAAHRPAATEAHLTPRRKKPRRTG